MRHSTSIQVFRVEILPPTPLRRCSSSWLVCFGNGRLQPPAVAYVSYLLIRRFALHPCLPHAQRLLLPITLDHAKDVALLAVKEPL